MNDSKFKLPSVTSKNEQERKVAKFLQDNKEDTRIKLIPGVDKNEVNWERNYQALKQYLKDNGGKYPSITSKDKTVRSLANWVTNQKQAYKG